MELHSEQYAYMTLGIPEASLIVPGLTISVCTAVHVIISFSASFSLLSFLFLIKGTTQGMMGCYF